MKVKMSEDFKKSLINSGCEDHVKEFGECVGIVEDKMFPDCDDCDEVNVRWLPSKLRYGYSPKELIIVE